MLGSEFEETQLILLPDDGAEQSTADWWQAIDGAVKRLLGRNLAPSRNIVAIAITGQWSGTVPVDEAGEALSNAIIWMDARGVPFVQKIADGALKVEGYALGKLLRWVQLTAGVPANSGKDPIARILYLKHTQKTPAWVASFCRGRRNWATPSRLSISVCRVSHLCPLTRTNMVMLP